MACKILVKELSAHETHRKHQLRLAGDVEIRIMRRLSTHAIAAVMPIVRLRRVHLTDGDGSCVAMDLCEGGTPLDMMNGRRQGLYMTCHEGALVVKAMDPGVLSSPTTVCFL
ncbi:hypothetical protein GOP47_0022013 [Adiantum capillus-veneris]|uniref:Uncharacterized protein n=1 Tax=Adiantum capillus-veneris TaxID=13818 RepID=A0A9D4UAK6_ADICA|nr:hypothetical protein GOP47_0022013 [Adiantum capillus-veneris]